MSKLSWWKRTVMAVGVAVAAIAAVSIRPKEGRSAEPQGPAAAPADQPKSRYFGSKSCADCHSAIFWRGKECNSHRRTFTHANSQWSSMLTQPPEICEVRR